jgi:hypothetical protein
VSTSPIEVIQRSLRRQPVSLKTARTLQARVSPMPIILRRSGLPECLAGVATTMRCIVHHTTPYSLATSLIARFVAGTGALTPLRKQVVSLGLVTDLGERPMRAQLLPGQAAALMDPQVPQAHSMRHVLHPGRPRGL